MLVAHLIFMALAHGHHHVICSEPFLTVNRWTGLVHGTGVTCTARLT